MEEAINLYSVDAKEGLARDLMICGENVTKDSWVMRDLWNAAKLPKKEEKGKTFVFDYVEIDSPFYRTPSKQMVKNWAMKTPKNFKFTAKFPKVITHEKRLKEVDNELERFFDAMGRRSVAILCRHYRRVKDTAWMCNVSTICGGRMHYNILLISRVY
jgi:Protein of unknown function DUF72